MTTQAQALIDKMVFRKTNAHVGRQISVSPANSTMKHLAYGRIILNSATPKVSFSNGNRETGLICLSGQASVKTPGSDVRLAQYDAIYIPRDSSIDVSTDSGADIAEFSSDVEQKYPLQIVRYAEISKDPGMKFSAGGPGSSRRSEEHTS